VELKEAVVVRSLYPAPHPRGRSASFLKRLKQPSNSLCTARGRRSPGPLTRDRGGSTFGQMVEACHSWLNRNRGILIRWSKKEENHLALLQLASALIAFKKAHLATIAATQPG
jgi:hypothetical protein